MAKVIRISDKREVKVIDPEPLKDAGANCGVYLAVMLIAVILDRIFPFKTPLTCVLVLVPYLLLIGFILVRRYMQRPEFPMGDPLVATLPFMLIWAGAALVAVIFAFNDGLLRPLTLVGKLNHMGTILEEPFAQEFVFRGALLTSLQQMPWGKRVFYRIEVSVLAGAGIYSLVQAMVFLAAGISFSDVVTIGLTSLILGVGYGWIYVKTDNVWYGVLAHMLINFGRWG